MRDGVSIISKRYSKTKNKYLKYYDPKQVAKIIEQGCIQYNSGKPKK